MRNLESNGEASNFMSTRHGQLFDDDEDMIDEVEEIDEDTEEDEEDDNSNYLKQNQKSSRRSNIREESEDSEDSEEIDEDEDGENEEDDEDDFITKILKSKGISDPSKINYEDEDGNIIEVDWNDLPEEDKINILTQNEDLEEDEGESMSENEINIISFMREKGLESDKDLKEYYKQEIIKELQENQEISYEIDEYDNDSLVFSRYKELFPALSDEDIIERMTAEKERDEELYNKNAESIRNYYKEIEKEMYEQSQLEEQEKQAQQFKEFKDNIVAASSEIKYIDEIELEELDKEEVISYILKQDANGVSKFAKDLDDPKKLFLAAWFLAKGDEAFKTLSDYYKSEIDKSRKQVNQNSNQNNNIKKTKVVKKSSSQASKTKTSSLHQLYEDDI